MYCSPDNLERRWYQNQQPRYGCSGGRLIRGLSGSKHVSEVYDDDDLMRLQQDDASVTALLMDDVVLGGAGGYGSRNTVSDRHRIAPRTDKEKRIISLEFLFYKCIISNC